MSSDPEVKFRAEELENSMGQFSNNQDIGKEIGNSKATQDKRVLDDLMFANSEVCQRLKNIDHKVIEKVSTTHSPFLLSLVSIKPITTTTTTNFDSKQSD